MFNGINQDAANLRAATLVAGLLKDFGLSVDRVVPHQTWTGKNCPTLLLNGGAVGAKWQKFLDLVSSIKSNLATSESVIATKTEIAARPSAKLETALTADDGSDTIDLDCAKFELPARFTRPPQRRKAKPVE